MTYDELSRIKAMESVKPKLLTARDIQPRSRTLLYGYTVERDTWHVYLFHGAIYTCKYNVIGMEPVAVEVFYNEDFVPNMRVYPARCDFEFCCALKQLGVYLPYTDFDETEQHRLYSYGYFGRTLPNHTLCQVAAN